MIGSHHFIFACVLLVALHAAVDVGSLLTIQKTGSGDGNTSGHWLWRSMFFLLSLHE